MEQRAIPAAGYSSTPPKWLVELTVPAARPDDGVLAALTGSFPLPQGVSSVSLPAFTGGTVVGLTPDAGPAPQAGLTDTAYTSQVVQLSGILDAPLTMIEQGGPAFDAAVMRDLTSAYDYTLEQQMLTGAGGTGISAQLPGIMTLAGINTVTYTSASPTASLMYPYIGQTLGAVANSRKRRPTSILLRFGRWEFLTTGEDASGLPLGTPDSHNVPPVTPAGQPDPVGSMLGVKVYTSEAVPANLGATSTQDCVIALRESDLYLFEGPPTMNVFTEVLSGTLAGRISLRRYVALVARYPNSVGVLVGSGMVTATNE
jgi:hypothetical protein